MQADASLGDTLLSLARAWIAHEMKGPEVVVPPDSRLDEPGATFVTLTHHHDGRLHGCIGSLEPKRALGADVRANALAAAFLDPRSTPLRASQLHDIRIEVSLLGPLSRVASGHFASEEDALGSIRPRVDGLVVSWGPMRGVLLPQVWEKIPDPQTFLACLKQKAGLPADFWSPDLELRRFGLVKWSEPRREPREGRRDAARATPRPPRGGFRTVMP
jgi:AmmeMemoRadiSam system protein A